MLRFRWLFALLCLAGTLAQAQDGDAPGPVGGPAARLPEIRIPALDELKLQVPRPVKAASDALGFGRQRLALVVGVGTIGSQLVLDSAARDTQAVATALRAGGFVVMVREDINAGDLRASLKELHQRLLPGAIGFVYLTGLGAQIDGQNLLLPRDTLLDPTLATPALSARLRANGVPLQDVVDALIGTPDSPRMLVVDAAYQHPVLARLPQPGLAEQKLPPGMMALFGQALAAVQEVPAVAALPSPAPADPREIAATGFARALVKSLTTPRISSAEALRATQRTLVEGNPGQPAPWLGGDTDAQEDFAESSLFDSLVPHSPQEFAYEGLKQAGRRVANPGIGRGAEQSVADVLQMAGPGKSPSPAQTAPPPAAGAGAAGSAVNTLGGAAATAGTVATAAAVVAGAAAAAETTAVAALTVAGAGGAVSTTSALASNAASLVTRLAQGGATEQPAEHALRQIASAPAPAAPPPTAPAAPAAPVEPVVPAGPPAGVPPAASAGPAATAAPPGPAAPATPEVAGAPPPAPAAPSVPVPEPPAASTAAAAPAMAAAAALEPAAAALGVPGAATAGPRARPAVDGRTQQATNGGERPVFTPRTNPYGYAEGDTYTYRTIDGWTEEVTGTSTTAIEEVLDNGRMLANGQQTELDLQGRLRSQRLPSGALSIFDPCEELWWSNPRRGEIRRVNYKETYTRPDGSRGEIEWKGNSSVGPARRIETPAGEFDALPIETTGWYHDTAAGRLTSGQFSRTVWYSPKVGHPVAIDIQDADRVGKLLRRERVELTHAQHSRATP